MFSITYLDSSMYKTIHKLSNIEVIKIIAPLFDAE